MASVVVAPLPHSPVRQAALSIPAARLLVGMMPLERAVAFYSATDEPVAILCMLQARAPAPTAEDILRLGR